MRKLPGEASAAPLAHRPSGLRRHPSLSDCPRGQGLAGPQKKRSQLVEALEKVGHGLQATRWRRDLCVTEVRPGRGRCSRRRRRRLRVCEAEAAPRLPEARCLEPGVSSAALACCRFPSQLLLSPPTGSRNTRHASTAGPASVGGQAPPCRRSF